MLSSCTVLGERLWQAHVAHAMRNYDCVHAWQSILHVDTAVYLQMVRERTVVEACMHACMVLAHTCPHHLGQLRMQLAWYMHHHHQGVQLTHTASCMHKHMPASMHTNTCCATSTTMPGGSCTSHGPLPLRTAHGTIIYMHATHSHHAWWQLYEPQLLPAASCTHTCEV